MINWDNWDTRSALSQGWAVMCESESGFGFKAGFRAFWASPFFLMDPLSAPPLFPYSPLLLPQGRIAETFLASRQTVMPGQIVFGICVLANNSGEFPQLKSIFEYFNQYLSQLLFSFRESILWPLTAGAALFPRRPKVSVYSLNCLFYFFSKSRVSYIKLIPSGGLGVRPLI